MRARTYLLASDYVNNCVQSALLFFVNKVAKCLEYTVSAGFKDLRIIVHSASKSLFIYAVGRTQCVQVPGKGIPSPGVGPPPRIPS